MRTIYVTYTFKDKAERDAFLSEIRENKIIETCKAEDGCIRYNYHFPIDADNQIFLWEQWASIEAQNAHTARPHFAKIGEIKKKYDVQTEFLFEEHVDK